jgi:excisionase family DNA binding protein
MQTTEPAALPAEYLKVSEVAAKLNLSESYIYDLVSRGTLRSKKFGEGRKGIRVETASVAEFVAAS